MCPPAGRVPKGRGEQNLEEELDRYFVAISVWDPQNMDGPIQTMELKVEYAAFRHHDVVDANFDGYQDFWYMRFMGKRTIKFNSEKENVT